MKLTKWDMADYIETEEDVLIYLQTAFEEGDTADIIAVLGAIARSKGMAELAKRTGVGRESLYKSLSKTGNPSFSTILKILKNIGLCLTVKPKTASQS
ncbi:MAG TPA: putative addiction module antidote protein [Candidatus Rifleibacterium sp.]|nr:putative addiction module antidote protein [Candidatus Rifleibacterium sp.]HPT48245.1 putative addiction module antidote protein [Candidatus Rifleibacterium sp.]